MEPGFTKALMIGATGMLGEATDWVSAHAGQVLLVARAAAVSPLAHRENVVPVAADWRDAEAFERAIAAADGFHGVDLAVLWMHGTGAEAKRRVLARLASQRCLVVDVLGSAVLKDLRQLEARSEVLGPAARRVTVVLGAMPTATGHRWLDWPEISRAVIASIEEGRGRVVGERP
ncbi:hypothetical protein [Tropicibacter sp. S64]|uniref:hypothetical protein n=1 Tax=Tropicibacter sp. S64 TaxID=3415122 RepID=UPI003C7AD457